MINVLITLPEGPVRRSFFTDTVLKKLESMSDCRFFWNKKDRQFSHDELRQYLKDSDACIINWGCGKLDDSILNSAEKLKFIGVLGGSVRPYIGEDFFDRADRVIVNSADEMARSVAEATLAYMLCALREIPRYDSQMKSGVKWHSDDFFNRGLFYKTIGLIGLGNVGRKLIDYLKPFENTFLVYDPYIKELPYHGGNIKLVELDELLKNSEIISIHAALTEETHRMLDKNALKLIRDGALLVNTARGGIIDERALTDELESGRFSAVLDVFEEEPLPLESKLRALNNVILIPHMAGPTIDMRPHMTLSVLNSLTEYFSGKMPRQVITREKYRIMT